MISFNYHLEGGRRDVNLVLPRGRPRCPVAQGVRDGHGGAGGDVVHQLEGFEMKYQRLREKRKNYTVSTW